MNQVVCEDSSSSDFSDDSSWSDNLEISDDEIDFDIPPQTALPTGGSSELRVSQTKSQQMVHPSEKRTDVGTTLRQTNQSPRPRSTSPVKRPNGTQIRKLSPPKSPINRGRPATVRSVSPAARATNGPRTSGTSVRVQHRPPSPAKKTRVVSPMNRTNLSREDVTPIHFTPRIKDESSKLKYDNKTSPKRGKPKAPALTPKIAPKSSKKQPRSQSPKRHIRAHSDDLSPFQIPSPKRHVRTHSDDLSPWQDDDSPKKEDLMYSSMPLDDLLVDEDMLESPKKTAQLRMHTSMPLDSWMDDNDNKMETNGSLKDTKEKLRAQSLERDKKERLRTRSQSPKPSKKPVQDISEDDQGTSRSLDREDDSFTETPAATDKTRDAPLPSRGRAKIRCRSTSPAPTKKTQAFKERPRSNSPFFTVKVSPKSSQEFKKPISSKSAEAPRSATSKSDGSQKKGSGVSQSRREDVPIGDTDGGRARKNAVQPTSSRNGSPKRTIRSISPRRNHASAAAVTMSGFLQVPAGNADPAEPRRYRIKKRQWSRRDKLIEFRQGSVCFANKEIEYHTPPKSLVIVWAVIGIELLLDLIANAISLVSFFRDPVICCGQVLKHDIFHLATTIPFILLVVAEIGFLFRAIFLTLWPKSTYTIDGEVIITDQEVARKGIGKMLCCLNWSPKAIFWTVNLLTIVNPFFGFFMTWILMYQSDKNEALAVMGIEAVGILLHFIAVHLERSAPTIKLKLLHMFAIIAWLATIVMTLLYLQQGGVCYNSNVSNFWFDGCEVCEDKSAPIWDNGQLQCPYITVILGKNYTAYEPVFGLTLKHDTICKDDLQMCWFPYE